MESIEQTSSNPKRKLGNVDDGEHFYSFDIEHEQSTKSFCCHSPTLTINSNSNNNNNNNNNNNINNNNNNNNTLTNYQQTTKIIQEFNIQQLTTSDITVSSTINIKSTPKQQMKISNNDLLSEADFQRVVQDITPADRDLFDEFLNSIKQKTDDYLFLSSFDDLPLSSQEQDTISKRHSSPSLSLPSQTSSIISTDRRRNSIPRGSSTIHYSPHSMPITNRSTPPIAAAQTLKQMAVQHQQRIMYNQQQQQQQQQITSSYSNYPYNNNNNNNSTRQYYQQSQISSENDTNLNPTSYYQPMCYSPAQQITMSGYNHHSQQHSNIYGIQNYSYQTSSSFYQPPPPPPPPLPQQQQQQSQQISTSSYSVANYSPSNGLLSTATTLPSSTFYSQDDNLPILDLQQHDSELEMELIPRQISIGIDSSSIASPTSTPSSSTKSPLHFMRSSLTVWFIPLLFALATFYMYILSTNAPPLDKESD
ncbi:unnamed protein product, partial [Rotaria sordida]